MSVTAQGPLRVAPPIRMGPEEVRGALEHVVREARRLDRAQWLVLREPLDGPDPLAVYAAAVSRDRFFFEHAAEDRALVAWGVAAELEREGPTRFRELAAACESVFRGVHTFGATMPTAARHRWVGGFAFDDAPIESESWRGFPPARLVLPAGQLAREAGRQWWSVCVRLHPESSPASLAPELHHRLDHERRQLLASAGASPSVVGDRLESESAEFRVRAESSHDRYREGVGEALAAMARAELEKVVLARAVSVEGGAPLDPVRVLAALRRAHPSCAIFAVARGGATWLGASPERLLRVAGANVEASALAGTAARGRHPEEDDRLARDLRESKKEQAEHAAVVRALVDALDPCCESLEVAQAPRVLALEGLQHLETPIYGRLSRHRSALELAGRLHPTPAVAGTPREAALDWLERHEPLERGWYAGGVGFQDRVGAGEFWVGLRSALIRGGTARLFAGAGLVEGSRPEAELHETRLKLRTMLAPLLEI